MDKKQLNLIQENLRNFANLFPHMIWITDSIGRVEYINDYGLKYLGFENLKVDVEQWTQTVHPDEIDEISKVWMTALEDKEPFENIQKQRNYKGEYEWFKVNATPYLDDKGEVIHWLGISININQEYQLSKKNKVINDRLDLTIKSTNSGIWDWDLKNDKIIYNSNWWEMLGYKDTEFEQSTKIWENLLHPDDKKSAHDTIQKHLNGESELYESIFRLKSKNGVYKWIYDSGKVVERDKNGNALRFIGMQQDYDSRKNAELIIIENERKMRLLAESAQELLEVNKRDQIYHLIIDKIYEYISGNGLAILTTFDENESSWQIRYYKGLPKFLEFITGITGVQISNMKGPANKLVVDEMRVGKLRKYDPRLESVLQGVLNLGVVKKLKKQVKLDSIYGIGLVKNDVVYGSISIILKDDNKELDADFIETLVNQASTTLNRKQAEDLLLTQNKELSDLNNEFDLVIQGLSHDLRSPLKTAMGLLEIQSINKDAIDAQRIMLELNKSLNKLEIITDDLLGIVFNNRSGVEINEIYFEDLIRNCIEEQEDIFDFQEISWSKKISQKLPFFSDSKRIKMILRNILSNAIKYQKPKQKNKKIFIHVKATKEKVEIAIIDNGIGMQKAQLDKIFNMFYRANHNKDGVGLGLHIIKQTLLKLNGTVEVKSKYGEGTEFHLVLPNLKTKNFLTA